MGAFELTWHGSSALGAGDIEEGRCGEAFFPERNLGGDGVIGEPRGGRV